MLKTIIDAVQSLFGQGAQGEKPRPPTADLWLQDYWRARQSGPMIKATYHLSIDRFEGTDPAIEVKSAGEEDIRNAVAALVSGSKEFFVLTRTVTVAIGGRPDKEDEDLDDDDEEYLQGSRYSEGTFSLEVNLIPPGGSPTQLESDSELSSADLLEAALDFRRDGRAWSEKCSWGYIS